MTMEDTSVYTTTQLILIYGTNKYVALEYPTPIAVFCPCNMDGFLGMRVYTFQGTTHVYTCLKTV